MPFNVEVHDPKTFEIRGEPFEVGNHDQPTDLATLGLAVELPMGRVLYRNDDEDVIMDISPGFKMSGTFCEVSALRDEKGEFNGITRVTLRYSEIENVLYLRPQGEGDFELYIMPDLPESRRRVG
jgi:hypothetical protein